MVAGKQAYLRPFFKYDEQTPVGQEIVGTVHKVDNLKRLFDFYMTGDKKEKAVLYKSGIEGDCPVFIRLGEFPVITVYQFGVLGGRFTQTTSDDTLGQIPVCSLTECVSDEKIESAFEIGNSATERFPDIFRRFYPGQIQPVIRRIKRFDVGM